MDYQSIRHGLLNQTTSDSLKTEEYKKVKVIIVMGNQQELLGTVIIPAKGYKSRLSDLMNNGLSFLSLTDVEIYQENLLITKTPFLSVNKQSIIYLAENDSNEFKNSLALKVKLD